MSVNKKLSVLAASLVAMAMGESAQAVLLVYEPFNYSTGTPSGSGVLLNGQSGGIGMTGSWQTFNTGTANSVSVYLEGNTSGVNLNTGVANVFDGTVANLPTSGGYFGSVGLGGTANTTDHTQATRALDPSVTATFTAGSTTWFSFVSARAFNLNATSTRFAIGAAGLLEDRGHVAGGEAIGVGGALQSNTLKVFPQFWDDTQVAGTFNNHNVGGVQVGTGAAATFSIPAGQFFPWATTDANGAQSVPNIIIGKIVWSDGGPDVISIARFLEADLLSEAGFDAVALSSAGFPIQPNLDQSQFDTISFQGGRYFADELRIGTTFADVIGRSVVAVSVPEPASAGLLVLGSLALLRRRRTA